MNVGLQNRICFIFLTRVYQIGQHIYIPVIIGRVRQHIEIEIVRVMVKRKVLITHVRPFGTFRIIIGYPALENGQIILAYDRRPRRQDYTYIIGLAALKKCYGVAAGIVAFLGQRAVGMA